MGCDILYAAALLSFFFYYFGNDAVKLYNHDKTAGRYDSGDWTTYKHLRTVQNNRVADNNLRADAEISSDQRNVRWLHYVHYMQYGSINYTMVCDIFTSLRGKWFFMVYWSLYDVSLVESGLGSKLAQPISSGCTKLVHTGFKLFLFIFVENEILLYMQIPFT